MSAPRPAARTVALAGAAVAALLSAPASAHLVVSGMGPVYDGVLHFGVSPEDLLPVVGLALFAGLRGPRSTRAAVAALVSAWLAGGALALAGLTPPAGMLGMITALLLMAIGGMLAWNRNLRTGALAAAAAVIGLVRGMADLAGTVPSVDHALALAGIAAAVFCVFCLAASLTLPLTRLAPVIAARVAGSWLAAVGLLMVGWMVRYGTQVL